MTAVIGVVIALLIAFVLLSIFFLVAYKQQKLCFKGKSRLVAENWILMQKMASLS